MYKQSLATLTILGGLCTLMTTTTVLFNSPASAIPKDGPLPRETESKPTSSPTSARSVFQSRDYPGAVKLLLNNSGLMEQVVTKSWNERGKGITEQKIKESLNGKGVSKGVNVYDANVNIGGISQQRVTSAGDNHINVALIIPGNSTKFTTTTPTIFGSYADPSFRVGFDLEVNLKISTLTNRIQIDDVKVGISGTNIHGSNATGTLVETFGDFFTKGGFSRDILAKINSDSSVKDRLAGGIASSITSVVPSEILSPSPKVLGVNSKYLNIPYSTIVK